MNARCLLSRRVVRVVVLAVIVPAMLRLGLSPASVTLAEEWTVEDGTRFFEAKIRPLLAARCYECHSENAGEQQGGLLLDRESGWINGGTTNAAVVPGNLKESLLWEAVSYRNDDLQMPPDGRLDAAELDLLKEWILRGAPGPAEDLGETAFSRLGDQGFLFTQAATHWAFQPVPDVAPPTVDDAQWNQHPIDQFIYARLQDAGLAPSRQADARTLFRRLSYDLTGLPPSPEAVDQFVAEAEEHRPTAVRAAIDELLTSAAFGEQFARMWLDVARYADTDSSYRPDTKSPRYFPFAFTYRDYVIRAFQEDKPFDQFVREQLAADLLDLPEDAPELAALGFLSVGPHLRQTDDSVDDWIDVTMRGLLGLTVACARCHDHKFEPVPTADYYSLFGVFASIDRSDPLDEARMPAIAGYSATDEQVADYAAKRAQVDAEISGAEGKVSKNNNRSISERIMETDLAELLAFHEGAPVHAMIVTEKKTPVDPYVFLRGERRGRGEAVPRRFLKVLDGEQQEFDSRGSGRLDLVERLVDPHNPLTARVFVNRVWGHLLGIHLVETPSDFGLQGGVPSHPQLLDWLARDFVENGWSVKHLVRTIVSSRTYQQQSGWQDDAAAIDPQNRLYWRSHRKRLTIEELRDSLLAVSGTLDVQPFGRPGPLWGPDYIHRRALYGFIDRFNLDPTLRSFDFPSPMQSDGGRGESVVAAQVLFTLNAPLVIDQALAITQQPQFTGCQTDEERAAALFRLIVQRPPQASESRRTVGFVNQQRRYFETDTEDGRATPWSLAAQALFMSNEFQYVD